VLLLLADVAAVIVRLEKRLREGIMQQLQGW